MQIIVVITDRIAYYTTYGKSLFHVWGKSPILDIIIK